VTQTLVVSQRIQVCSTHIVAKRFTSQLDGANNTYITLTTHLNCHIFPGKMTNTYRLASRLENHEESKTYFSNWKLGKVIIDAI
jgi:hypothetical protein